MRLARWGSCKKIFFLCSELSVGLKSDGKNKFLRGLTYFQRHKTACLAYPAPSPGVWMENVAGGGIRLYLSLLGLLHRLWRRNPRAPRYRGSDSTLAGGRLSNDGATAGSPRGSIPLRLGQFNLNLEFALTPREKKQEIRSFGILKWIPFTKVLGIPVKGCPFP